MTFNKVVLPVINLYHDPQVVIFDLETMKRLRSDFNILGVLTGTLSSFPQQNLFLSVPLRLNVWEVIWLVENNIGILIDIKSHRTKKMNAMKSINNKNHQDNMVIVPNTDKVRDEQLISECKINIKEYLTNYIQNSNLKISKLINNYRYYKHLQNLGYFINPGIKFGGDLVIYPGDPLRYHSYSTIKLNFCDMEEIIVGGRLATSVKKNLILIGYENDNDNKKFDDVNDKMINELYRDEEPLTFSIEWSGFG